MPEFERHMIWYALETLAQNLDLVHEEQGGFKRKFEVNQKVVAKCKELVDRDRAQQEEIREASYRVQGDSDD